jgi:ribosomal 50S subunit-recycling heat shock protein
VSEKHKLHAFYYNDFTFTTKTGSVELNEKMTRNGREVTVGCVVAIFSYRKVRKHSK